MLKSFKISPILLLVSTLCAIPAQAADVTQPVKVVMEVTVASWAENGDPGRTIFSEDLLKTLYSRNFVERYRAAAKFPAFDGGDSPFDYDVITNSQDGCPVKDLSITSQPPKAGVAVVVAKFNNTACFGSEAEYQALQEVRFDVIEEQGKPVIADIHTSLGDNEYGSLLADMEAIAAP